LGINWNLAPSIDVNNNSNNPVIGVRSFGESPEKVAEFGRASMKGMQDAGMITTIKHFPGHGDTNTDSHLGIPVIEHDMNRLEEVAEYGRASMKRMQDAGMITTIKHFPGHGDTNTDSHLGIPVIEHDMNRREEVELKPFTACINQGADTVLTAHIHFPAIESENGLPATLSKSVITHLLREKMHFNGVVTTDCMEMEAISKTIGTEKGAVATIKAGSDFAMI